jgi:hypothetical protein
VLPEGMLSNQKSQYGLFLAGLAIEDVGNFTAISSIKRPNGIRILWPFGTFCGHLVYFSRFGKNLATLV